MKLSSILSSLLISTLLLMTLQSCQSGLDPKVEAKKAEVMAVHDEVMPLMSTTRKLKKKITAHNHGGVDRLINDLDAADETMMQWMSDFNLLDEKKTVETQMEFLDKMEGEANKMKAQFAKAINNAENYVNNHKH